MNEERCFEFCFYLENDSYFEKFFFNVLFSFLKDMHHRMGNFLFSALTSPGRFQKKPPVVGFSECLSTGPGGMEKWLEGFALKERFQAT